MIVRKLREDEWPRLQRFYTSVGDTQPFEALTPRDAGFVAADEKDEAVAVGFLILPSNLDLAMIEFLATDHGRSQRLQAVALSDLVLHLEREAAARGFKGVFGLTPEDHFSLIRYYERRGARAASKLFRLIYKLF